MQVSVRLFAGLRERAGTETLELELPEGARVQDALDQLAPLTDGAPVVLAVNREYADRAHPLGPDDEIALIPPVSGGSDDEVGLSQPVPRGSTAHVHARVTEAPLRLDPLIELVRDPRAGALVTFLGVTREVTELEYEAYVEMAESQLDEIVGRAIDEHGLCAAAAWHRTGTVPLSEPSVAIAVSAPHRAEAFAGARQIIDQIKATAPIWKKEEGTWTDGVTPA